MRVKRSPWVAACVVVSQIFAVRGAGAGTLTETQSFTVSGGVTQAVYSDQYNLMFLRDGGADLRVVDLNTDTQISLHAPGSATSSFSDLKLSPSGRYLYAADYGGTVIGYGTPSYPSYVHRYDLQTRTWSVAAAPAIAYKIEPVDDNRVLLQQQDQWVALTLNTYTPGAMTQLTSVQAGYSGDIEYDSKTSRIYHVESGISLETLGVFTLNGNTITSTQSKSGGAYVSYPALLSADGTKFYTGPSEVQAYDVTKPVTTFSETIGAACRNFAFGTSHYYDPNTGAQLGALAYSPVAYALGANARDIWMVQQPSGGSATLHHFTIAGVAEAATTYWNLSGGASWATASSWRPAGNPDGADNTVDFSQTTLAADATVTLDGSHTVGGLAFGDLGGAHNWSVAPGTGGAITLQVSTGVPTINVTGQTASINVALGGSQGLAKSGVGTLVLNAANTYTGGTTISGGTLAIAADNNLGGAGALTINAGTLEATSDVASARGVILGNPAAAIQVDGANTLGLSSTVSGTGGLTKLGSGTLDLTAATLSYTGATTVSGGTLNVGAFSTTAALTIAPTGSMNVAGANTMVGNVANSGNLNFNASDGTTTISVLSGTGTTMIAAGANVGTLSSGKLTVGGTASINNASGGTANLNGATATITALGNATVILGTGTNLSVANGIQTAGGIAGPGSLTKTSTATLMLASSNVYTGGTTIAAGTLQIGNGGTTGSIVGDVLNYGVLIFNRSDRYTFAGNIGGMGSVNQSGGGVLTLTGANTIGGGMSISHGTVQIGDGVSGGGLSGDVANYGALVFNTPSAGQSYAGAINGNGALTKTGPGTLVLTGNSGFTGGTTVDAGALQIGNGGTVGSLVGNVVNNGSLVFDRSDSTSFAGNIVGTGAVTNAGGGTLTLSGTITSSLIASAGRVVITPTGVFSGDLTTSAIARVENSGGGLHVGNLDNSGVLVGNADLTGTFTNRSTGDVRLIGGQKLYIQNSGSHSNAGLIEALGNQVAQSEIESIGAFTNQAGGHSLITGRNASLRFDSGLTNQGAIALTSGVNDMFGRVTNSPGATIAVTGGAGVTFYDDVVQNGSMVVSAVGGTRSSAVFLGSFSGSGGFTGGGDVFFLGDLRPGNSPAEVFFGGNLYMGPSTRTVMEISGRTPGRQFDKIDVSGSITLDGSLNVVLYDNFTPQFGDTFDLLDGSMIGRFQSISLPALSDGLSWDTGNLYTTGTIGVVPEPTGIAVLAGLIGLLACARRRTPGGPRAGVTQPTAA